MALPCAVFEDLDLLDLWHLYGMAKRVQDVRSVSVSKVSRRAWGLVADLGLEVPESRGAPSSCDLGSASLLLMRQAYQQWRLEQGRLKVLPTFTASVALRELSSRLDVLPDVYLKAEELSEHLLMRRVDIVISASLDLAGELIEEAQSDPHSPFAVVPLFRDELRVAVNPAHPLAGMAAAAPEDCQEFPSAAYPEGVARLGADALGERGLWRLPCRRDRFDPAEWFLAMRSPAGLSYDTLFLAELMPQSQDLVVVSLAEPLYQTNYLVMLKELVGQPELEAVVAMLRRSVLSLLAQSQHPHTLC